MNTLELGVSTAGSITNPEKTFALAEAVRQDLGLITFAVEGYAFIDSLPYKIATRLLRKLGKIPFPAPLTQTEALNISEAYPNVRLAFVHDAFDYNLINSIWTVVRSDLDLGSKLQHAIWPILMGTVADRHALRMVKVLNDRLDHQVDLSIHADSAALLVSQHRTTEMAENTPGGALVDPAITYKSPVTIEDKSDFLYDPKSALKTFIRRFPKSFKGLAIATDHIEKPSIKAALDVIRNIPEVQPYVFSVHVAEPGASSHHGISYPGESRWNGSHTKKVIDTLKQITFAHNVKIILDTDERTFGKMEPQQQRLAVRNLAEYVYN